MLKEYDLLLAWEDKKATDIFAHLDTETFFRLHPHWIINSFSCQAEAYTVDITDHDTEEPAQLTGKFGQGLEGYTQVSVANRAWQSIDFFAKNGNLHAEVKYHKALTEDEEKLVVLWLRSITQYLRLYQNNTLNSRFFRMLMNRVILQMTPSQRKISLMLIRITFLELLVILIILVGWFLFIR